MDSRDNCQRKHPADVSDRVDDKFSIVCGDLGLGEGLRPGGMLQNFNLPDPNLTTTETSLDRRRNSLCSLHDKESSKSPKERRRSLVVKSKPKYKSTDGLDECGDSHTEYEHFPSYADVPLGTSLRQQKKLFEQNLGSLRKRHESLPTSEDTNHQPNSANNNRKRLTSEEIEKKLLAAMQEVEELKIELDTCQKRLDAKYMAIAILKKQADETTEEHSITEKIARECSKMLAEEVNKLQFELEWRESSFLDSQQTWAVRFDRIVQWICQGMCHLVAGRRMRKSYLLMNCSGMMKHCLEGYVRRTRCLWPHWRQGRRSCGELTVRRWL